MIRTYVDSCVLIAGMRGDSQVRSIVNSVLGDENRLLVSSAMVALEVLPKAVHFRRTEEVEYYQQFFELVEEWVELGEVDLESALEEATAHGLSAGDAIHVIAAVKGRADELVTAEAPTKPIHRVSRISVVSLREE